MRRLSTPQQSILLRGIAVSAGLLTLIAYIALSLFSLRSFVLETSEANILSIAAASLHGQPLYHPTHSPDFCYTLPYGPVTYLLYRTVLIAGHGAFWPLRAVAVLGNLLLCATFYSIFRKLLPRNSSIALMAFSLAPLMQQVQASLGLRADVWVVLALSLAMRCSLIEAELPAAIAGGLFAGLAINFKLTAAPAIAFILLVLYRRKGLRAAAIAAAVAAAAAAAPFALPGISLTNYFAWLLVSRSETAAHSALVYEFLFAFFLLTPLLVLRTFKIGFWPGKSSRRAWPELALLTLCLTIAAVVAAKPGGGPWHLWHLLPLLGGYVALSLAADFDPPQPSGASRADAAICLIALTSAAFGLSYLPRDLRALRPPTGAAAQSLTLARQEIDATLARYHGRTVQMGYGPTPNEPVELLRYMLPLRGQPYAVDGNGRVEAYLVPFPPGVIEKMNACTSDVWLIPRGEQPFAHILFPGALRTAFTQHYAVRQTGTIYDVWVCKAAPPDQPPTGRH